MCVCVYVVYDFMTTHIYFFPFSPNDGAAFLDCIFQNGNFLEIMNSLLKSVAHSLISFFLSLSSLIFSLSVRLSVSLLHTCDRRASISPRSECRDFHEGGLL